MTEPGVSAARIVGLLAASDPVVFDEVSGDPFCALCNSRASGFPYEEVVHGTACPWLLAKTYDPAFR